MKKVLLLTVLALLAGVAVYTLVVRSQTPQEIAADLLEESGVQGGLVVHLGCEEGELTAALKLNDSYTIHGLERDPENVASARRFLRENGLNGKVTVDLHRGNDLPYIDNLVNLLVSKDLGPVPMDEVMRVLCPEGVALIKNQGKWTKTIKPRPQEIDEWTHYLYDSSGNAVSHDQQVGPPRHLQWLGSPRWSRHHDHMSSMSALVSSGGRVFYIFDEGTAASIELPARWFLIARDAFNGTVLWKRQLSEWHPHLWPLKSGPAQLPRRLVARGNSVFVTLGLNEPVSVLDAATGETLQTLEESKGAEEIILSEGTLFVLVDKSPVEIDYLTVREVRQWSNKAYWDEEPQEILAIEVESGEVLWSHKQSVMPVTLAADDQRVYFHDGESVISLDRERGEEVWCSEPAARSAIVKAFFAPTLVVNKGVVLFAGGERAGEQRGEWYTSGEDTVTAFAAENGEVLWEGYHPPSGYRSPEDLLVINDRVWTGETTSGRVAGEFTGRDIYSGTTEGQFSPNIDTYWFHHRCYRSKATERFILTSRAGIEFIDPEGEAWKIHHWVRGSCLYGIMPGNGLVYAPQNPCACYLEAKQSGFNALAPSRSVEASFDSSIERLEKGDAYGISAVDHSDDQMDSQWPTYRYDSARSGYTRAKVSSELVLSWATEVGKDLTSLVVGNDQVFLASSSDHTLHSLDIHSGEANWQFTAGGRIDSPPTVYKGYVIFGCADGWVYALRASDGEVAWRFLAAAADRKLISYEQIESVWPLNGATLIKDDTLYVVSGRSMFLDGGLCLWRLDPLTGEVRSKTILNEKDSQGKDLHEYVSWLNMPTALPDVLSSDGALVYMRSQPFNLDGTRLPLEKMPRAEDADRGAPDPYQIAEHAHLFSPVGFLDDSWWHRSYWVYGSTYISGWSGYFLAGRVAPAGRIMVFDRDRVYGFGREPEYYRWTTPLEHQLFSSEKQPEVLESLDNRGRKNHQIRRIWQNGVPMLARAMVLADRILFVSGPPDLVDEVEAANSYQDPDVQRLLFEQQAAINGESDAIMWAVSADTGKKLAEYKVPAPPVFDGMVATSGRIYMASIDGKVTCFEGRVP